MASRCRTCGHLVPRSGPTRWPTPTRLAAMAPYMGSLLDAAQEYDSFDPELASAEEFVRAIDVAIQEAAGYHYRGRRQALAGPKA